MQPDHLTFYERVAHYEAIPEAHMKGAIRPISRQRRCPECRSKYIRDDKEGFVCPTNRNHKSPTHYQIEYYNTDREMREYICSDKQGQALDSYVRAKKLLAIINTELEQHTFDLTKYVKSETEKFYVCNLLDGFVSNKKKDIAPSYQKDYKRYIVIAKDYWKTKDVRDITKHDIKKYREHCQALYPNGKSAKNLFDNYKTFMIYCMDEYEIINRVPKFEDIEFKKPEVMWCMPEEQIYLFNLIENEQDRAFVHFLALHGCRPGEARALLCKDVDLRTNTMLLSKTFSGKIIREQRKGKKAQPASIPIHGELLQYITERVKKNLPDAFLFVNPRTGRPYSSGALERLWNEVRKKAKLPDKKLKLYGATRHSIASQLANSGASQFLISKTLCHSDIRTSEKYMHTDVEAVRHTTSRISMKKPTEIIPITKKSVSGESK